MPILHCLTEIVIVTELIKGGDIVSDDGQGFISIYGKYFNDENLQANHTGPGFLAMVNQGPNTNGCQFYITTLAAPWLDGKNTIFGKVVKGAGYVHVIERVDLKSLRLNLKLKYFGGALIH